MRHTKITERQAGILIAAGYIAAIQDEPKVAYDLLLEYDLEDADVSTLTDGEQEGLLTLDEWIEYDADLTNLNLRFSEDDSFDLTDVLDYAEAEKLTVLFDTLFEDLSVNDITDILDAEASINKGRPILNPEALEFHLRSRFGSSDNDNLFDIAEENFGPVAVAFLKQLTEGDDCETD